jgi:ribulose-phosphate 3-epimerase
LKKTDSGKVRKRVLIAPSILAADFSRLGEEIKSVEEAGADMLHVDVMDGHFVPNITVGVPVVASLRGKTSLPLDVHLMIHAPERFINAFAEAGSDYLTVHVEIRSQLEKVVDRIHKLGVKAGLAIKPGTGVVRLEPFLDKIEMVLLMTVEPGFGGQTLIPDVVSKVRELKEKIERRGLSTKIEVDGGINKETAGQLISAGADILVAGTSVFGKKNRRQAIRSLRGSRPKSS